jgi:hypothetical protein
VSEDTYGKAARKSPFVKSTEKSNERHKEKKRRNDVQAGFIGWWDSSGKWLK